MKPSLLAWSLLSLLTVPTLATAVLKREETDVVEDGPISTTFNGIEVPPALEMTPDNFRSTIGDGYWYALQVVVDSCRGC